jgi:hypothetical protein
MKINISADARPQVRTLLIAAAITIALWYIPYIGWLTYPFRLFVTFIHEGGHALAALLTGNSVASLIIATDASGETYTSTGNIFSQMFVSSAGYLGATAFGALLLIMIRRAIASRIVLVGSAALILGLTLIFGLFKPLISGTWGSWWGVPFTLLSGLAISAGLVAVAKYAKPKVASFFVSFLAVQCVLNALLDLKTIFMLSFPGSGTPTDAGNMQTATGVPAMFWAVIWIGLSFLILSTAMRFYAVSRKKAAEQQDLPFEEPLEV